MKNFWLLLGIAFLMAACQPKINDENYTPIPSIAPLSGLPIPVELSALAANPSIYEGAYIQLTGQYTRLPRLICELNPQPSPATWGVVSDTLLALASGFDDQLRPLIPEGLTMTVAGRWQHWQGPVGCDDNTTSQDIWYLEAYHIISPSPITLVTLTPGGSLVDQTGEMPETEATAVVQSDTEGSPGEAATATPPVNQPTQEPGDLDITQTVPVPQTPTPTPATTSTATGLTPTSTVVSGIQTPTLTSTSAVGTPVPTSPVTVTPSNTPIPGTTPTSQPTQSPNATPTSTPAQQNIDKGGIDPDSLFMEVLGNGEKHQWTFSNDIANNKLTVNTASVSSVDLAISILDPSGALLVSQNNSGTGQIEVVSDLNMPEIGDYQIIISAANSASGGYGVMALDDLSSPFPFDLISLGSPVNTSFNEDTEQLWFFTGTANDSISITAVPDSLADIGIDLLGPDGETLEVLDMNVEGETEELTNYTLPATGLYVLWLYGFSDSTISVNLLVVKN